MNTDSHEFGRINGEFRFSACPIRVSLAMLVGLVLAWLGATGATATGVVDGSWHFHHGDRERTCPVSDHVRMSDQSTTDREIPAAGQASGLRILNSPNRL